MFGHQDEPTQQQDNTAGDQSTAVHTDTNEVAGAPNPALPPPDMNFGTTPEAQPEPVTDTHNLLESQATDGITADAPEVIAPTPAIPDTSAQDQPAPVTLGSPSALGDLKQQALQQLSPLVGHLDQTPEEKFRTTMMMIQAADNQDLLQTAYDAANQITDEKAKAQALLDVINEINYFSQKAA